MTTRTSGKYYNCQVGYPPYEAIKFTRDGYTQGSNTVTGQAFLKQLGGGVVTCAGNVVEIYPNNAYFHASRLNGAHEVEKSIEADSMLKTTLCDALGNFEFADIPDGEWRIEVMVQWHINNRSQGGMLREDVTVKSNEKNRFIISR